jgi:hypothetical protein
MQLMRWMAITALLSAACPVLGQGTKPRPKAADYLAHAEAGPLSLGVEYLIHSLTGREQTLWRGLPGSGSGALRPGERIEVSQGHFALRINGRKEPIPPQAPPFVAASLKYPDWEMRPTLEAGAGIDGGNTWSTFEVPGLVTIEPVYYKSNRLFGATKPISGHAFFLLQREWRRLLGSGCGVPWLQPALAADPIAPDHLYINSYDAFLESADAGRSWKIFGPADGVLGELPAGTFAFSGVRSTVRS